MAFLHLLVCVFLSVGTYVASENACSDLNADCGYWAARGYCKTSLIDFMAKNCKQSCDLCSTTGTVKPTGSCGRTYLPQSRIISGVDAKPGAWPWMAALVRQSSGKWAHYCGASLITPTWVLTATHCVDQIESYNNWKIKLGEHNYNVNEGFEQVIDIKRIIMHPKSWADVALIELKSPARLNNRVKTICLPSSGVKPRQGSNCYLSGWGSIKHPGRSYHILQQARLPVVDTSKCRRPSRHEIVCAGFGSSSLVNACRGDSGGPLVCQQGDGSWVQHGIASFVITYCKYYTGFVPVNKYRNWINQYVQLH